MKEVTIVDSSHMRVARADTATGARIALPREYAERAAYLISGAVEADGLKITATQMAVFGIPDE